MRYLSEGDVTQMMGIGHLGEVRQGPDGNLYQYVQGVDGLGNPIGGFWSRVKGLRRGLKSAMGRALPLLQRVASFVPGPYGAAVATALKTVTPILKKAGVAGYEGIGALYEAPDGSLYQVQGLAEDEDLRGIDDEMTQMMGIGYVGEMRQGPDGNLYQYVQGMDGLGNPIGGFWSRVKSVVRRARQIAPLFPGGAAALTVATPFLKQAGVAGSAGLAEDDELRGLAEDEELRGLEEDEELRGLEEDEELRGLDDDEDLRGLDEDEELRGFAEDEELRGVAEDQDMQGIEGYIRQDGMSGLEAYVPQAAPQTRWHVTPAQPPEVWKPLW